MFRQGPVCLAIFARDDKDSIWIHRPHEAKGCNANNFENPQKSTHPLKQKREFSHSPLNIGRNPKGKDRLPINFSGTFAVKFRGCQFINGCSPVFLYPRWCNETYAGDDRQSSGGRGENPWEISFKSGEISFKSGRIVLCVFFNTRVTSKCLFLKQEWF